VNRLVFPLSKVAKTGGHSFDEEVLEADLRPPGAPESSLTSVRVDGTLTAIDTEFMFRGRIRGVFERPCDRCLEPASESVEQSVTWLFEPSTEAQLSSKLDDVELDAGGEIDDGERARYYQGDEIDLALHVWEEMVLAAPTKFYCQADCRGLCPNCGKNLNDGACGCAPETQPVGNSGLAGLKDLFPNLPSKQEE
jgi:uncharacterized metal-binding protein YceD (DUF177 family)